MNANAAAAELFQGFPEGAAILHAVQEAVSTLSETTMKVTKSQVAFRRRRGFAYLWRPGQYINSDVPAVLSIALPRELRSDRIKEVAHPSPHTWMHHIELRDATEVDHQILEWLTKAHENAR